MSSTDERGRLWWLNLSSYQGIVGGASHWYVRLRTGNDSISVVQVLDGPTAARRRKADPSFGWRAGMRDGRFDTKREALAAGIACWLTVADVDTDVLLSGRMAVCDPLEPLAGPARRTAALGRLYDRNEGNEGWDGDHAVTGAICAEWDGLVRGWFTDREHGRVEEREIEMRRVRGTWKPATTRHRSSARVV